MTNSLFVSHKKLPVDGDGKIDSVDPGCEYPSDTEELDPITDAQCSDGIDNDGDGKIDSKDFGCDGMYDNDETDPITDAQCSDGIDNDGDGKIDSKDPGCETFWDDEELDPTTVAACSDGVDNDEDGKIDALDPGCNGIRDNDETDPIDGTQCSDGVDNDGDGRVDMDDPGCSAASDNNEVDVVVVTDVCANIDGVQTEVPAGMTLESEGQCVDIVTPLVDVCLNLDGIQTAVPEGKVLEGEGQCVNAPIVPASTGEGASGTSGSSSYDYWGCTDSDATNYNALANKDDGQCKFPGNVGGSTQELVPVETVTTSNPEVSTSEGEVLGATVEAISTCAPILTTYMRYGRNNDSSEVKRLQDFLNVHEGETIPVTGYFGALTKNAVERYQLKYASEVLAPWVPYGYPSIETATGYAYKMTLWKINSQWCTDLHAPLPEMPILP
ncbi:MAG: hypothetical protein UY04_C0025G0005 [Parcubacteria group bacterium GW2011_GWA2_47_7]|nr:MAG: hypothetical protein UY04_C0025G0005 [Parcubacteria group bacterium GW2011_GWA2_47_7]